jgi:hypothetical protein
MHSVCTVLKTLKMYFPVRTLYFKYVGRPSQWFLISISEYKGVIALYDCIVRTSCYVLTLKSMLENLEEMHLFDF